MKKICYITTISLTIKSFFVPQLKHLADKGYQTTVICSYDESLEKELCEHTKYIPVEIARGISPLTIGKSIVELTRVLKREKFDMVQYSTPNAAFVASVASRLAGIRIRNYHLMGFRYLGAKGILRYILKILEKVSCANSTHIECVSKSNLELGVREKIFSKEKACVVWNGSSGGVDLKRFDAGKRDEWRKEIRQKLEYKEDDFVFGFVGRVTKDKGIDELLSAFLNLREQPKLLLVGHAEGVDTLNKELYESAGKNENIKFVDAVSDIEKYYAAIDVLVFPSYREGFGNVVIEAAATGTPAIISNIPGPVDAVIPDVTAKLVEARDVVSLQGAMEDMLNDRKKIKEMSEKAYNFVLTHFDSAELNNKISERKDELLKC